MTLLAFLRHLAFCAALAMVSAMVVVAMISARVMDLPDARKAHTRPTPKGGGVGVVVAFMLGIAVVYSYASFARIGEPYFRGVILGSLLIAAVSYLDDLRDWPFAVKLGAQLAAAAAAIGSGLYIASVNLPGLGPTELGWFGPVATLVWIVFATNAMNFIDGLDGLAAGTALVASLFLAGLAQAMGGYFVYVASMLLAAGLVGFLPFNFPRARIFLGDVGSQFCGYVLAILGVAAARFDSAALSFLLVPLLLSGVLFDVTFTLLRRAVAGDPLTKPHRSHLYQIAQRSGMDARAVALVHWGFAAWGGLICFGFESAAPILKPWLVLLALPPQLAWLAYVAARARRARLGAW